MWYLCLFTTTSFSGTPIMWAFEVRKCPNGLMRTMSESPCQCNEYSLLVLHHCQDVIMYTGYIRRTYSTPCEKFCATGVHTIAWCQCELLSPDACGCIMTIVVSVFRLIQSSVPTPVVSLRCLYGYDTTDDCMPTSCGHDADSVWHVCDEPMPCNTTAPQPHTTGFLLSVLGNCACG